MSKVSLRTYNPGKNIDKNVLYHICQSDKVECIETHGESKDIVNIEYDLGEGQYGIYGYEYKRPGLEKDGCKVADVLACVVDENKKEISTFVFDIKRDISAFSDDLYKADAMITAIKEVRDFIKQIAEELLHKESFMIYYKAEGYSEAEKIGMVTSSFEAEKFADAAHTLESLMESNNGKVSDLVHLKLKNNLRPYMNLIEPLYMFAERKVLIRGLVYELYIYLLERINEKDYYAAINVSSGC